MKEREALKLALEALEKLTDAADGFSVSGVYFNEELWAKKCLNGAYDAIIAIKEALAQTEQEPVAWAQFSETGNLIDLLEEPCGGYVPLYTTPPQRTWVWLTDEEIADTVVEMNGNEPTGLFWRDLTHAIEAKLKEKNT